jgi:peptide/nickel transport system permease protein
MKSSVPEYVICLTAWIYLVNEWGIFKDGDSYLPLTQDPKAWFGALLLPWLILGLTSSTDYARFTRGAMAEVLGEDYIRTAMAKGISANRVVFGHALRVAIVPIVTIFGLASPGCSPAPSSSSTSSTWTASATGRSTLSRRWTSP